MHVGYLHLDDQRRFVVNWVGEDYYAGDPANLLVAIYYSILIWRFGFLILLHVPFEFKRSGLVHFCRGVFSLALGIVLLDPFGLPGLLAAAIIGELLITIPFVVIHILKWVAGTDSLFKVFVKIHWAPFLLMALWVLAGRETGYRPSSWSELIISSLVMGSSFAIIGGTWL